MAILRGCEEKNRTPKLEERVCPRCGKPVEVFTRLGRITEESVCECGYVFRAEQPLETMPETRAESE